MYFVFANPGPNGDLIQKRSTLPGKIQVASPFGLM